MTEEQIAESETMLRRRGSPALKISPKFSASQTGWHPPAVQTEQKPIRTRLSRPPVSPNVNDARPSRARTRLEAIGKDVRQILVGADIGGGIPELAVDVGVCGARRQEHTLIDRPGGLGCQMQVASGDNLEPRQGRIREVADQIGDRVCCGV